MVDVIIHPVQTAISRVLSDSSPVYGIVDTRLQSHAFTKQSGTFLSYMNFRKKKNEYIYSWMEDCRLCLPERWGTRRHLQWKHFLFNLSNMTIMYWCLRECLKENKESSETETLRCFTSDDDTKSNQPDDQSRSTLNYTRVAASRYAVAWKYTIFILCTICLSTVITSTILVLLKP